MGNQVNKGSESDIFIDALRRYPDLWNDACNGSKVICCPTSISLGNETMSKEHLMSHILVADRKPGDYTTLNGEKVTMSGNDLICVSGFSDDRHVRILMVEDLRDPVSGKVVTLYRTMRPLKGGITPPEEADEICIDMVYKYILILRSFPGAETIFNTLDEYLTQVNFVGQQSRDGFSNISPSLASSLKVRWKHVTDRFVRLNILLSNDKNNSKNQLGQIIESYMMNKIHRAVYKWICEKHYFNDRLVVNVIEKIRWTYAQSDLGIRPEFQTSQIEAIKCLCTLNDAVTPVDKLLAMKRTVTLLKESVDRNVQRNFPNEDIELATDDIVLIIIYIMSQASLYYKMVVADVRYASDYHFVTSSKSHVGYILCHFQVAVKWFADRIETRGSTDNMLYNDSSTGSDISMHGDNNNNDGVNNDNAIYNDEDIDALGFEVDADDDSVEFLDTVDYSNADSGTRGQPDSHTKDGDESITVVAAKQQHALPKSIIDMSHKANLLYAHSFPSTALDVVTVLNTENAVAVAASASCDSDDGKIGTHIMILGSDDGPLSSANRTDPICIKAGKNKMASLSSIAGSDGYHSVVDARGKLYTWGVPDTGRLGRGVSAELDSCMPTSKPTEVLIDSHSSTDITIKSAACGKIHMLAVTHTGELYAWGDNRCAQLGLSSDSTTVIDAKGSSKVTNVASNGNSNSVDSLSYTSKNELNIVMAVRPTLIAALQSVKVASVACGAYHSLCLTSDGIVYSWGRCSNGRLGQFPESGKITEHSVAKPGKVRLTACSSSAYGSTSTAKKLLYGSVRYDSDDGMESTNIPNTNRNKASDVSTPVSASSTTEGPILDSLSPLSSFVNSIYTKSNSATAGIQTSTPTQSVSSSSSLPMRIVAIAAGYNHSMAVADNGSVYTWGCGLFGRLGHASHADEYLPKKIKTLDEIPIVAVAAGKAHTMLLSVDGALFGCGLNNRNQLNVGKVYCIADDNKYDQMSVIVPCPVSMSGDDEGGCNDDPIVQVCCGDSYTAVMSRKRSIYVWGKSSIDGRLDAHPIDISTSSIATTVVDMCSSGSNLALLLK